MLLPLMMIYGVIENYSAIQSGTRRLVAILSRLLSWIPKKSSALNDIL